MQNLIETRPSRGRPMALTAAVVVATITAATLVACNRSEPQTIGQTPDSPLDSAQAKSSGMTGDVQAAAGQAADKNPQMAAGAANPVKDAAITSAVNARIAQDPRLGALHIDVQTVNGRVVLRGNAPDTDARERAQQLATAVQGVVGVDNQLVVGGKG
ncbi:MAG TPA: BON domain-containing protein [Burkholderiaceae bacterium]|nr:BON domain-containing protein [Burkholderiaceae bacterium]